MEDQIVLVVIGFIIAFVLAFGIGANDVANSFGTSVGSKVLTLKQACYLATIFEIAGSLLIGAQVSGTIRKGIVDPMEFQGDELTLMLGYVSALTGCCIWLIVATVLNLPVSGTHSIVGATIGMAIVSKGFNVIKWYEIGKIVVSWLISPLLSGLVSLLLFLGIRKFILRAASPLKAGLRFLPIIYMVTICINVGGILEASPPSIGFDLIPWWGKLLIVIGLCAIVYFSVWIFLVPFMKKKVEKTLARNLKMKLDNDLEKKKLNSDQCEEQQVISDNNQVCYINLKTTKDNDDDARLPEYDELKGTTKQTIPNKIRIIKSSPNTAFVNPSVEKFLTKNPRERLISAPCNIESDLDVNLTLRGYLHTVHATIHTPLSAKNIMQIKESKSHQGGSSLSKIFKETENKDSNSDLKQSNVVKRGRFNIVPGKLNQNESSEQANLVVCEESPEKIEYKKEQANAETENVIIHIKNSQKNPDDIVDDLSHSDPPEAAKIFSFLQILTAIFGAFAHGGNDVSNAIGPLIGLYLIYDEGIVADKAQTPWWILFYGGVGISVGLWILGRRVIKTIGEDLTKITASSGFVIEIASAMTVLAASLLHIPVSTTHCKVGSVVFTGRVRSKESVDWSLFRNIIIAWIVTVPVTGTIAAGCQFCLVQFYKK